MYVNYRKKKQNLYPFLHFIFWRVPVPITWAAYPQGQPQHKRPRPTVLSRGSCLEGPEQSWCHLHCGGTKSTDCLQHGGWHLSDRWREGWNLKLRWCYTQQSTKLSPRYTTLLRDFRRHLKVFNWLVQFRGNLGKKKFDKISH